MGLFKQEMDFDKFSYFALTQIGEVYETNKESVLDKAQWENANKLTKTERDKLWSDFMFFIPIGLDVYAIKYFGGNHENSEIVARITEAYVYYLHKYKKYNEKQVKAFMDGMIEYFGIYEELVTESEEEGRNGADDIISNAGVAFTNIYSRDDRTAEQLLNEVSTKNSDKMFVALKLVKSYLIKGGILDKLYKGFKITW